MNAFSHSAYLFLYILILLQPVFITELISLRCNKIAKAACCLLKSNQSRCKRIQFHSSHFSQRFCSQVMMLFSFRYMLSKWQQNVEAIEINVVDIKWHMYKAKEITYRLNPILFFLVPVIWGQTDSNQFWTVWISWSTLWLLHD